MSATFEIFFILILILANGLLAMAEIAIVSARKARLQHRAEMGDRQARAALELALDPNDLLSTTQIGITLVGILAGAFGGATIADPLSAWLARNPALMPYSGGIAIALVVLTITYLSLILGELVPKRLALNDPERAASRLAGPMKLLARLTYPLVRFLNFSTDLVVRLLGMKLVEDPPVTEEEIRVMLEVGTQAGVFVEAEQDMVEGVFRLADRRVGTLMTPRREVVWIDLEDPREEVRRQIAASTYSRLPVGQGSLDQVVGIVQAKDLLTQLLTDGTLGIPAALVPPQFVPGSMPALNVLEMFRKSGVHIALVIDEFGGLQGLVTLQDIVEGIVGDLPGLGEGEEQEIVQREDGSWLLDGALVIDDVKEVLGLRGDLPDEDRGIFNTLGGFIMTQLGRIPDPGDHFIWAGIRFEVVDMDGRRVDKVLVQPERDDGIRE